MRILLAVCLGCLSLSTQAGLVKWVDENGAVHYSDQPPRGIRSVAVPNVSGRDQPDVGQPAQAQSYVEREAELKKAQQEKQKVEERAQQEIARAEEKRKNCTAARQNLQALQEGARIVTYDANGERSFLDDDARTARIEAAQQAINQACN